MRIVSKGLIIIINISDNNWIKIADDPIKSTLASEQGSLDYTGLFGSLLFKARRAVRLINEKDELLEVRVHTRKHEAILTPDDKIAFVTIQKPVDRYQNWVLSKLMINGVVAKRHE